MCYFGDQRRVLRDKIRQNKPINISTEKEKAIKLQKELIVNLYDRFVRVKDGNLSC